MTDIDLKLWKTKMAVGRMAYEAGMFRQASQHFQRALELVEEKKLPDELLSKTLVNLAKTLGSLGHYPEAEKMLRRALRLDESISTADAEFAVELIEDYHQLSLLYWRAGKPDLAGEPLDKAFELLKYNPEVPDELTAKLLKHRAVLLELAGDFKTCEKIVSEALNFIQSSSELGKHASIYGDCLMVKVMLLMELDRFQEATELFEEAKQILEISRGASHPKILQLIEALEEHACRKGMQAQAEALHRQAEEIKVLIRERQRGLEPESEGYS
jgi:tetratricopeptide (TPR) repeat protein